MKVMFIGCQNIADRVINGGEQCSKRNYKLLLDVVGKNNFYTALICNNREEIQNTSYFRRTQSKKEIFLSTICLEKVLAVGDYKKFRRHIDEISPDIIFWDSSLLGKHIRKGTTRNIVFFHNIESSYSLNKVKREGFYYIPSYFIAKYNEKMAVERADSIICLNNRDSQLLKKLYSRGADCILPISFDDIFDITKMQRNSKEKTLLFIGSFFPPNYNGIKWFVKNVMNRLPDYRLVIVGKNFEKCADELSGGNVETVGTVEDLSKYYYGACCIVMPILYGAGMKVKTAEAMMYGMNIFASDEALEGYAIDKLSGVYRCNTATEFILKIKDAFREEKICEFNQEVRQYFLEHFDTKCLYHRMQHEIEKVKKTHE